MNAKIPRIVLAGTGSGSGKTTIICALLQALKNREISCGAFKCGPDYIDPMFHRNIIGAESSNLDLFFFVDDTVKQLIYEHGKQRKINIIEGVMGFYDGMSLSSEKTSTYDVARVTDSPVVLIVNGKGAALSVLATIHGFLTFLPDSHIRGVILNHVSAMTYQGLKKEILRRFEGKVLPLGFLPEMKGVTLESRHLGLVTADEVTDLNNYADYSHYKPEINRYMVECFANGEHEITSSKQMADELLKMRGIIDEFDFEGLFSGEW